MLWTLTLMYSALVVAGDAFDYEGMQASSKVNNLWNAQVPRLEDAVTKYAQKKKILVKVLVRLSKGGFEYLRDTIRLSDSAEIVGIAANTLQSKGFEAVDLLSALREKDSPLVGKLFQELNFTDGQLSKLQGRAEKKALKITFLNFLVGGPEVVQGRGENAGEMLTVPIVITGDQGINVQDYMLCDLSGPSCGWL